MRKFAVLFSLLALQTLVGSSALASKTNESFLVTVGDRKISVVSPEKPVKIVTIVVKNDTFDRIISEIKTDSKTLKRFTLEPSGKKGAVYSLTVDISKTSGLHFVSIAPPFQEVPLAFSPETYEIP